MEEPNLNELFGLSNDEPVVQLPPTARIEVRSNEDLECVDILILVPGYPGILLHSGLEQTSDLIEALIQAEMFWDEKKGESS